MDYQMAFRYGVWGFVAVAGFALCAVSTLLAVGILSSIFRGLFSAKKGDSDEE